MLLLHRNAPRGRRGVALISALLLIVAAAGMAMLTMTHASITNSRAELRRHRLRAQYLAEAGVETVLAEMQESLLTGGDPEPEGTLTIDGIDVAFTVTTRTPRAVEQVEEGLWAFITDYTVEARATTSNVQARSRRIVQSQLLPLFQFAMFYENDLELWPGPPMTLGGPVHCNADMYLGCQNSLTMDTNYVRAVGNLYLRRKHSNAVNGNDVRVRRYVEDPNDASLPKEFVALPTRSELDSEGITSVSGLDSDFGGYDHDGDGGYTGSDDRLPYAEEVLQLFSQPDFYGGAAGHTLGTQDHGVGHIEVPEVESIAMFVDDDEGDFVLSDGEYVEVAPGTGTHSKGPFHGQAGLTILTKADGSWEAYDELGFDVSSDLASVVSVQTLYDDRQEAHIDTTTIDVAALNASGRFPSNGLLYTATYGAGTGADVKGTVLTNGAELSANLSVVTESSIYIQGDYNTVAKKSAAVMCDAVSLLSNAWNNSKSPGNLPSASNTTYNVSLLTGNVESEWGNYNGGAENLPRFHENWGGKTCTLRGSITVLWNSRYANALRLGSYSPPSRDWSFDSDLFQLSNMPPFTPMVSEVEDLLCW